MSNKEITIDDILRRIEDVRNHGIEPKAIRITSEQWESIKQQVLLTEVYMKTDCSINPETAKIFGLDVEVIDV